MRHPQEIKDQIRKLEQELKEVLDNRYQKIEDYGRAIGLFHVGFLENILALLNRGEIVQIRHSGYSFTSDIYMNPQRNSILLTKENEHINSSNILSFITFKHGDFYLDTQPILKNKY